MGSLTTIPTQEVEMITKSFSADTGLTYSKRELKTVEDCKEQYLKAPEVASLAQSVIKDRMQGDALLKAKQLICGAEWDKPLNHETSKKWLSFLDVLDLVDKKGCQKVNVGYLLDFAGYKERGGEIETASHYREVKKITGSTKGDVEVIDNAYHQAGGGNLKTAKEVKVKVQEVVEQVNPYEEFFAQYPQYKEGKQALSSLALGSKVMDLLPETNRDEWKPFYRKVSSCVHPDKGGSQEDMALLAQLNKMFVGIFDNQDKRDYNSERSEAFARFCTANDYNNYSL